MTTLRLRKGWTTLKEGGTTYIYPPGKLASSIEWYASVDGIAVAAYPHGKCYVQVFGTIEEAHAYLIEKGSESPWEVTP